VKLFAGNKYNWKNYNNNQAITSRNTFNILYFIIAHAHSSSILHILNSIYCKVGAIFYHKKLLFSYQMSSFLKV
jgi:hypothetical protein